MAGDLTHIMALREPKHCVGCDAGLGSVQPRMASHV